VRAVMEAMGLQFGYGAGLQVVADRLVLGEGRIMGLIGPNGSGKSTLLKLLALLLPPQEGRILFMGDDVRGREGALRGQVTMLLQEPYLLKRSVYSNVAYPVRSMPDREDRIREAIRMVGLGDGFLDRPWYRLSGGEAQRVALASRLALHPRVLILDEPVSSVDREGAQVVRDAILSARERWGTSVLVTSHQPSWLSGLCDGFWTMGEGRLSGPYGLKGDEVVP